jgi:hypothetical protein
MNDLLQSNDNEKPVDCNVDFNLLMQNFTQPETKKEPKVSKNRAHFNITDFYELRKIKYTLEF